jgi:hypothetical protein
MLSRVKYGTTAFTLYCGQYQFLVTVMRNIMASAVCSKIIRLFLTYRRKITGFYWLMCAHTHTHTHTHTQALNSSFKSNHGPIHHPQLMTMNNQIGSMLNAVTIH